MRNRITPEMNVLEIISALSSGNVGAAKVCSMIFAETEKIDPQSFSGGIGGLFSLDTHGIYGEDIWILYKNVCNENLINMLAAFRSVQLGHNPESWLKKLITHEKPFDFKSVVKKVMGELSEFNR